MDRGGGRPFKGSCLIKRTGFTSTCGFERMVRRTTWARERERVVLQARGIASTDQRVEVESLFRSMKRKSMRMTRKNFSLIFTVALI